MKYIQNHRADLARLVTRLIIGGIFITTGWMKVSTMPQTLVFFHQMGLPPIIAYIVSYCELVGGPLLILGCWSLLVSVFLSIIMIGAFFSTYSLGFQTYVLPLAMLTGLISILGNGAGEYRLKSKRFN